MPSLWYVHVHSWQLVSTCLDSCGVESTDTQAASARPTAVRGTTAHEKGEHCRTVVLRKRKNEYKSHSHLPMCIESSRVPNCVYLNYRTALSTPFGARLNYRTARSKFAGATET